jgi:hypothetical protein
MPRIFSFEFDQIKTLLAAVRLLEDKGESEVMLNNIRAQLYGPIAGFEPFMRGRQWLKDEIAFECEDDKPKNNVCGCGQGCKGKMCAPCWRVVYRKLHGKSPDGGVDETVT